MEIVSVHELGEGFRGKATPGSLNRVVEVEAELFEMAVVSVVASDAAMFSAAIELGLEKKTDDHEKFKRLVNRWRGIQETLIPYESKEPLIVAEFDLNESGDGAAKRLFSQEKGLNCLKRRTTLCKDALLLVEAQPVDGTRRARRAHNRNVTWLLRCVVRAESSMLSVERLWRNRMAATNGWMVDKEEDDDEFTF